MNFDKVPDYLKDAALEPFDLMDEPDAEGVPEAGFVLPYVPETAAAPGKALTLDASDELEAAIPKAFRKLNEILDLDLNAQDEKEWQTLLRVQMTAVQTVLNTQVRVDDQRLRRRQSDNIPKLLEALARHEKSRRQPVTIDQ
jgi:hypothetical protein